MHPRDWITVTPNATPNFAKKVPAGGMKSDQGERRLLIPDRLDASSDLRGTGKTWSPVRESNPP